MSSSTASPQTRRDFFQYAVHIIYAAILAFSFQYVAIDFIPFDSIKTATDKVNFLALLFVWGFMISGWLGYTKSISYKPHSEGFWGAFRFVLDLIISFFMLYLVIITIKDGFVANFGNAFSYVIPVIFGLFIAWDLVKYAEYRSNDEQSNRYLRTRANFTIFTFLALLAQSLYYYIFAGNVNIGISYDINSTYFWFMIASSAIVVVYRLLKGNIPRSFTSKSFSRKSFNLC